MDEQVSNILKDYFAAAFIVPRVTALAVCGAGAGVQIWFIISKGVSAMRVVGAGLLGFGFVLLAFRLIMLLKGRGDFKRECAALGENALGQYDKGIALGKRRFMDDYLLFYGKYRPHILRYGDIETAEQRGMYVRITYKGGRGDSAVGAGENAAIILAALKSRNDGITFIIKGKIVDTQKKGRSK